MGDEGEWKKYFFMKPILILKRLDFAITYSVSLQYLLKLIKKNNVIPTDP